MSADSKGTANILLVDDNERDLVILSEVLAPENDSVVIARSGDQALRELLVRDFAVILLDVRMPKMDGFEVASIIKQRGRSRHTPIIFLTAGDADVNYIYRAYSVGAVDYLIKPIEPDIVRAKVAIFVELFRKSEQIKEQSAALLEAGRREREQKLAELKQTSERRYRNLAEAIPQIVWTADPDGSVNYFNRQWRDYTGMSHLQSTGWDWLSAMHPEDVESFRDQWDRSSGATRVFEQRVRLRRRDGVHRWHLCRAVPESNKEGHLSAWLGTYTDVDDFKRAQDAAEEAIRLRDDFLAIASHELRTPLTSLSLQIDGLRRKLDAGGVDGHRQWLIGKATIIRRHADRLARLIESLLDVSRISQAPILLTPEEVDLEALTREVLERLRAEIERSGSGVQFEGDGSVNGLWDRLRLEQVVTNLVANAIKYGGGQPIVVSVRGDTSNAMFSVKDSGIGVPDADKKRIFRRFERAASIEHHGGLGLGLWIVRQIVEAMGGSVELESEVGRGSTFTVEIPRRASSSALSIHVPASA